jgi:hypothetical protein
MDGLLLIFLIFGSTGFIVWRLLLVSKDRYGENAPLKVSRTYQITGREYFASYEQLISIAPFLLVVFSLGLPFTDSFSAWEEAAWLKYLLAISMLLISLFVFTYNIFLQLNYWKFTKDVVIKSVPSDHTVQLYMNDKEILLKNDTIEKILMVSNRGRRSFSYFIYYLKNGQSFILTDRTPGRWIIKEYFRNIPVEHTYKYFPLIK